MEFLKQNQSLRIGIFALFLLLAPTFMSQGLSFLFRFWGEDSSQIFENIVRLDLLIQVFSFFLGCWIFRRIDWLPEASWVRASFRARRVRKFFREKGELSVQNFLKGFSVASFWVFLLLTFGYRKIEGFEFHLFDLLNFSVFVFFLEIFETSLWILSLFLMRSIFLAPKSFFSTLLGIVLWSYYFFRAFSDAGLAGGESMHFVALSLALSSWVFCSERYLAGEFWDSVENLFPTLWGFCVALFHVYGETWGFSRRISLYRIFPSQTFSAGGEFWGIGAEVWPWILLTLLLSFSFILTLSIRRKGF